jgi:hypothetical protein
MQRITDWNVDQRLDAMRAINEYKRYRALDSRWRNHPFVATWSGRHVNNLGWGWDAIQSVAVPADRTYIMVYRAMGNTPSRVIYPRGLAADAVYRIVHEDAQQQGGNAMVAISCAMGLGLTSRIWC